MGIEVAALLAEGKPIQGTQFELADAVAAPSDLSQVEGVPIRTIEEPAREPVHVWIDFSQPQGTLKLLEAIEAPIVVATTGFDESQLSFLRSYAERFPVLLTPNTSPGITLFKQLLRQIPKDFPCEVVVTEAHHIHKKDAPSGTAKALLSVLQERGFSNPQVHVTRAGNIRGEHSVKLICENETIEIHHSAQDRKLFAQGALIGAQFLVTQDLSPKIYTMEEVFNYEVPK